MTLRRIFLSAALAAVSLLATAFSPALAGAAFGIEPGSLEVQTYDGGGGFYQEAGGHPDRLDLEFKFIHAGGTGARDLIFDFSPGLTGSPIATKTCPRMIYELFECPEDTIVGEFHASFFFSSERSDVPVYNVDPAPGQLIALAFKPQWETELEMNVRPSDFGLSMATYDMPQLPFSEGRVELWGIPGDHNGSGERRPFLTTSTACGPMRATMKSRSWEPGSTWITESTETLPFQNCQNLPFDPSLGLQLTNPQPDSPTGARIEFNLPDHSGPDEQVSAAIKDVKLDLPPGLSVSPGGVEGREVCDDSQFGLGTSSPVTCPFQSRVGSVEVRSGQLRNNLVGSLYLGRELPGQRFRLFIAAAAPGLSYKAVSQLVANSETGQLSTSLEGLPQFGANQIALEFDGGPKSLLATPVSCGPATARARFTPYSGSRTIERTATVNIGSCAAPPFSPGLTAGSTDQKAGGDTSFTLTLNRQEGEQLPGKFSTTMPPGLSAKLKSVPLCSSAGADTGNCPESSRIGSAVGEVGPGPGPAKVPGAVYLTDSYKGAPYGLAIIFRAAIGPFDLGTLAVRATLRIDPHTGQITIEHTLPTVFEGVPLRFRTIGIDLTRPGFLVNPTSCGQEQLSSTITSVDGRGKTVTEPFTVGGCEGLSFRPKFSVALDQRGKRAENPELSFQVNVPAGDANVERMQVNFPRSLEFHNAGLKELCPRADAVEDRCRGGARVGTAVAISPLVGVPLTGPVYVVKPQGGGFPDLWSTVEGQGVKLQLQSDSHGKRKALITELVDVPDLPLQSFEMKINGGGKKGALFSVNKSLCSGPGALSTPVEVEGHNGALSTSKVQMKAGCPKSAGKKKRSSRAARGHSRSR